ncbi:MAG: glycosyltransferase family 2 protein [Lachnospiraceae bacterium]|nr:glycosyltransferase family 2 protein [Lachnospiraceae bacterium]
MDYRELYEEEHLKCADLAGRVAELEAETDDLKFRLDRIRNNPLWKASKPLRVTMHFCIRQVNRIRNQGSVGGVFRKIAQKKREKKAMAHFGTESFPDEEQRKIESKAVFPVMPKISILVPLYNTPEPFLREMTDSVLAQTYGNWELCLADGSDDAHPEVGRIVREYIEKEEAKRGASRIVYKKLAENRGISGNTNECLTLATGEYIGLFDHDDVLHPSVLYEYVKAINEQGADYLYCDETTFRSGDINRMLTMHFKPDYAIDNLRANNYICHFSVFKKELLDGTELFRPQFDGSQDHDMILRLTDRAKKIVHIPRLMYYWRCHEGSTASNIEAKPYAIEAARGAVADHLRRHGYKHFRITSTRAFETIFKIRYEIEGNPKVSIIIPNRDHFEDLSRCVTSILEKSTYDNFEIVIVENNSREEKIFEYYKQLSENDKITIVTYKPEEDGSSGKKEPFNYSKVNNFGAKAATGEYLLLLNNDTEVITVNWIEEMLMYAQRKDVACVGAKLYYPDKTIQHAGVVLGLGAHRTAGHSHYRQHRENLGYMGRLCYAQDVSAVTGACLMVKRSLFEEAGGLGEDFAVSLNDVDFCLRLRELGYLNVFTPFAELYHYESASRGTDLSGENAERYNRESEYFRKKWKAVLDAGDPYYNPNFSLDRSDFSLKLPEEGEI